MIPGLVAQSFYHPLLVRTTRANAAASAAYTPVLLPQKIITVNAAFSSNSASAYVPSFLPIPTFASTVLLIGADTSLVDESSVPKTLTANGNVARSTTSPKFGAGCIVFDGTGDFLELSSHADFDFSNSPFSIEAFLKPNSATGGIISNWSATTAHADWAFYRSSSNLWFSWTDTTGTRRDIGAATTMTNSSYYHVAVSFGAPNSNGFFFARLRVNGVVVQFGSYGSTGRPRSAATSSSAIPKIGTLHGITGFDLNGSLDELRIIKGYDIYDTDQDIVVPTSAFPRS